VPDVLPNLTQQSRLAATGGAPATTQVVKKTVEKIFEAATTVVKQGATQAKNLVSEKVVIQLADVLVIGGGLSGLTVAEAILEKSKTLRVFVLEASDRVGGRIKTDTLHVGTSNLAIDGGASWINKKQHENIVKMCERFGVELCEQYGNKMNEGRHVVVRGQPDTRRTYHGEIPAYSLLTLWEIQYRVLRKIEILSKKVPIEEPWNFPEAKSLDKESVASYFEKKLRTAAARSALDATVMHLFGCHSSQVSLLHFLHLVRCAGETGELKTLLGTDESSCFGTRLVGGAQQICEKLAETIRTYEDAHVETNARVVQIRARNLQGDHPIVVTTADNKKYLARTVVIAGCPSTFVNQCSFVPRMPLPIERFGAVSFRGTLSRAIVVYPGPFWRGAGFSGFARNIDPSPQQCVSAVYDYCGMQMPTEGSRVRENSALVCLISGDVAVEVGNWPDEKRKESVLASLALMFPKASELSATPLAYYDYFPHREDPFGRGGPMTVSPPGQYAEFSAFRHLRKPLAHSRDTDNKPLIYFASAETSALFPGTMEGAIACGKEIALEVNTYLASVGRRRAGGGENESEQFFQEEEAGGMFVLRDDVWVATNNPTQGKKSRGGNSH